MKHTIGEPSIYRASKATLADHHANFTLDGLKFHFRKLKEYANPTGGALDKIPLNTKAFTAAYYAQFEAYAANPFFGPPVLHESQRTKPIFLRKKAQYQVADHLLGIGKKAYWTGSTGKSTLLGLDIDDHQSKDAHVVQANAQDALHLFVEMTGLKPVSCNSPGGINAFLICHKTGSTTQFVNETWHAVVRNVNSEAQRRGLVAKLECKGKARIFTEKIEYCGVQFKDPLCASNPTDDQLHAFWEKLESQSMTGPQILQLLQTLENEKYCADLVTSRPPASSPQRVSEDDLLPIYRGQWAKQCRQWAIHGLPCDDSIATVVTELAKWLYFVELERIQRVKELLTSFCLSKHNGYITRLKLGQEDAVKAQIQRIVDSVVSRTSDAGRAIFATIQAQEHMKLVPLMQGTSSSPSFSSVKSTECCTVSNWLPAPEYRRQRAEQWVYLPDDTPLPNKLKQAILKSYAKKGLKIKQPTMLKIQRFLNHLWTHHEHEARLGVDSLRKMGFGNAARKHLKHLEAMGVIDTQGYCPAAGVSKLYRLRPAAVKMFANHGSETAL